MRLLSVRCKNTWKFYAKKKENKIKELIKQKKLIVLQWYYDYKKWYPVNVLKNLQIVHIFLHLGGNCFSFYAWMENQITKTGIDSGLFLLKRLNFLFISKYYDLHAIKQDFVFNFNKSKINTHIHTYITLCLILKWHFELLTISNLNSKQN